MAGALTQVREDVAVLKSEMGYVRKETESQGKKIDNISSKLDVMLTNHAVRIKALEVTVDTIKQQDSTKKGDGTFLSILSEHTKKIIIGGALFFSALYYIISQLFLQ